MELNGDRREGTRLTFCGPFGTRGS